MSLQRDNMESVCVCVLEAAADVQGACLFWPTRSAKLRHLVVECDWGMAPFREVESLVCVIDFFNEKHHMQLG